MKKFLTFFLFFTNIYLSGQENNKAIEGVAAVVGEIIILKSDVSQVVGMTALQRGLDITKDVDLLLKMAF